MSNRAGAALFALLFLLGAAARIALLSNPGFEFDVEFFRRWAIVIQERGLGPLGRTIPCDYMPLYLELLPAVAWAADLLRVEFTPQSAGALALLKAPAIVADLACASILYFVSRRDFGIGRARAASLLYWLNPAILFTSAAWGQVDSIVCLFSLGALLLLARHRFWWAGFALGLAIMTKLQPVLLIPVFALFAWTHPASPASIGRSVRAVGVGALGFTAACTLAILPFVLAGNGVYLWKVLTSSVDSQPRLALGANNFWWLLYGSDAKQIWDGYRWADALSYKETGLLALTGFTLAALLAAWLSSTRASERAKKRSPVRRIEGSGPMRETALHWLAFFLGFAFYMVPTQMHERYLLYALPALLLAWARGGRSAGHAADTKFSLPTAGAIVSAERGGSAGRPALVLYIALAILSFITISANLAAVYPENVPWLALHSLGGVETRVTAAIQTVAFLLLLAWASRRFPRGWLLVAVPAVLLALGFSARFVEFRKHGLPLSELRPAAVRQQFGTTKMNTAASGAPLASGGRTFERGLGTVAPSALVYRLESRYVRLTSHAALEEGGSGSAVRIAVVGDRAAKFTSVLESRFDPATIEVDLDGVNELILAAEPADPEAVPGNASVQWLDPRLFRE